MSSEYANNDHTYSAPAYILPDEPPDIKPDLEMPVNIKQEVNDTSTTSPSPDLDDPLYVNPDLKMSMDVKKEFVHTDATSSSPSLDPSPRPQAEAGTSAATADTTPTPTVVPTPAVVPVAAVVPTPAVTHPAQKRPQSARPEPAAKRQRVGAALGCLKTNYPKRTLKIGDLVPCIACGKRLTKKNLRRHVSTQHQYGPRRLRTFVNKCVKAEERLLRRKDLEERQLALMSDVEEANDTSTSRGGATVQVDGGGGVTSGRGEAVEETRDGDVHVGEASAVRVNGGEAVVAGCNEAVEETRDGDVGEAGGGSAVRDGEVVSGCGEDVDETRGGDGVSVGVTEGADVVGDIDVGENGGVAAEFAEMGEKKSCACCACHRRQEAMLAKCLAQLQSLTNRSGTTQADTDEETQDMPSTSTDATATPDSDNWLLLNSRGDSVYGTCRWCSRYSTDRGTKDPWSYEGVLLETHKRQKMAKHEASKRHERCVTAARICGTRPLPTLVQPQTSRLPTLVQRQRWSRCEPTESRLIIAYSMITRGSTYADFQREHLLLDALGVKVGNEHRTHSAAAECVDVIYDVFRDKVTGYIRAPNPVTGRARHVHLSTDKVTVAGVTRQVVNMRLLDTDANTVVVRGTTAVMRPYPDPVPIYTATLPPRLREAVTDCNESNGRGVFAHVTDYLHNVLGLKMDEIGRQALSVSSDCDAMYTDPAAGFGRTWRELHSNPAFMHLSDRPHRLESLLEKIEHHTACTWVAEFVEQLRSVSTVFMASQKLTRQAERTAKELELLCVAFQRLSETRCVAYSVEAIECLLTNRDVAAAALEGGIASGVIDKDIARSALNSLMDVRFLINALVMLDIMRPAVALSKAGQAATYTVFDDKVAVHQFKADINKLTDANFQGRLEKEGPAAANGTFRGSPIHLSSRYPSDRHPPDVSTGILQEAADRRRQVGLTLLGLPDLDTYLEQTAVEELMTDIFDFARYPTDKTDLETHADDKLVDLVTRLCDGTLTLPRPCGSTCLGPKCPCLLWQFREFKCRVVAERQRFRREWLPGRSGVVGWLPEAVLRSFMRPETDLHAGIPDIAELIEICLLLSRSQADTERVGKASTFVGEGLFEGKHDSSSTVQTNRSTTSTRLSSTNEQDRAMKQVFIRENQVPIRFFPAPKCADHLLSRHQHALKRKPSDQSLKVRRLNREGKYLKFMF